MIVPVIIAGGTGSRLWPLSREIMPKPFIAMMGEGPTLLQLTLERLKPVPNLGAPLIVCNAAQGFLARRQAASVGQSDVSILLEPVGRNTGPALCAAALRIDQTTGPEVVMLVLPADHNVTDADAFCRAVLAGEDLASQDYLVTFAIKPTSAVTGYGYLKIGPVIDPKKHQFKLDAFVEKPSQDKANEYLTGGDYAWNSGIFMFKTSTVLRAFEQFQPEILQACTAALPANLSSNTIALDQSAFAQAKSISIDYAIMEQAPKIATVQAEFGWSDVGDWNAVWQASTRSAAGNAEQGNIHAIECCESLMQSSGPLIVGLGLQDMMVVGTKDAILVAPRSRSQDVKKAVEALAQMGCSEAASPRIVEKPWGWYESLHSGPGFQVKEISVYPGAKLSLQRHRYRAEQWVCIKGQGLATRDGELIPLGVNQVIDIPLGTIHRLENAGEDLLSIIEVQIGSYTGEDDIERLEDIYGRK